jgi:hypothetical protein
MPYWFTLIAGALAEDVPLPERPLLRLPFGGVFFVAGFAAEFFSDLGLVAIQTLLV